MDRASGKTAKDLQHWTWTCHGETVGCSLLNQNTPNSSIVYTIPQNDSPGTTTFCDFCAFLYQSHCAPNLCIILIISHSGIDCLEQKQSLHLYIHFFLVHLCQTGIAFTSQAASKVEARLRTYGLSKACKQFLLTTTTTSNNNNNNTNTNTNSNTNSNSNSSNSSSSSNNNSSNSNSNSNSNSSSSSNSNSNSNSNNNNNNNSSKSNNNKETAW